jgi:uncharacterized membrane protein
MHGTSNIREQLFFRASFFVFALIFASITFVNHYCFRTYAFDLGINNNAIYDYAHFRWNDCMVMQPQFTNVLSDHFSLIPLLVSPLYWLFGSYTMLVVQWVGVLFGGYGIYVYFKRKSTKPYLPVWAMIYFFSMWGIYSALAFDYHDNLMAAMFVPWFINYFDKQNWHWASFFFILILIAKENMALWMVFLAPALGLLHWHNKKLVGIGFVYGFIAMLYFAMVVGYVIPSLANENRAYMHFKYDALGENYGEAITTIFTRPAYTFQLLLNNPTGNSQLNHVKPELWKMLLLSGLWALFLRPQYLIMVLPILAQKLFSNGWEKWGIYYQYSIEFAPILAIAVFDAVDRIKKPKIAFVVGGILTVIAFGAFIRKTENKTFYWYDENAVKFYAPEHYRNVFDVNELHRALKIIPDSARVSAQHMVVPHLCFRDYVYSYPVVLDASYVVLLTTPYNTYRMKNLDAQIDSVNAYRHKPDWEVLYDKNATLIARRKTK